MASSDKVGSMAEDELRLQQMGYNQRLTRVWTKWTNTFVTISSMSVLLSITASLGIGLTYGGPVVCIFGWLFVTLCVTCQALGMAELASSMPTSGGMYYWMYVLTGPEWGPVACWVTGWLNLLGQIASLASTHMLMASVISTLVLLSTGGAGSDTAVTFTAEQTLGIFGGCLLVTTLINSLKLEHVTFFTDLGGWWHVIGAPAMILTLPLMAVTRADASWVFFYFDTAAVTDLNLPSYAYAALLGLLLPAYQFTGLDGPAHMAEESVGGSISPARGILLGVAFTAVVGLAMVISLLFCIPDLSAVLEGAADGDVVFQIIWNVFLERTGSTTGALVFMMIPLGGIFFCALGTLTYVARITFAYSRDQAVPLSSVWVRVNPHTNSPLFALWATSVAAFCLGLPTLGSDVVFTAVVSLSTIALTLAYVAPIFLRITVGRSRFVPGPFNLGWWAYPCGIVSSAWALFAMVIFALPTEFPVATETLNYAGIALGATLLLSLAWYYFPFIGGYTWFRGPVREVGAEANIEVVGKDAMAKV